MNFIEESKIESFIGGLKNETPRLNGCEIIGDNLFKKAFQLSVNVPSSLLGPNFRDELISLYKNKYENKVFHLFYIIKIDTKPLNDCMLPLIPVNSYLITNTLNVEFYTILRDSIIELSIIVYNHNNKPYIKGQNRYVSCKIIPSSEYKVVQKINNYEIIFDNGKVIKERDNTYVKIKDIFSSNECQTEYIICEGEFYLEKTILKSK